MTKLTLSAILIAAAVATPISARQAASIDTLLKTAVDQKRVPMAVAMVVHGQHVAYAGAYGAKVDAIFAIACGHDGCGDSLVSGQVNWASAGSVFLRI